MSAFVLGAIDGTADWRRTNGTNSHVYKFYRDFATREDRKRYFDGPNTSGSNVGDIESSVLKWMLKVLRRRFPHLLVELRTDSSRRAGRRQGNRIDPSEVLGATLLSCGTERIGGADVVRGVCINRGSATKLE